MKILYVKNNSDRVKQYQLKTIIFEENGKKFVKKQALCHEAISHLKKMKENYRTLTDSIINPKIKLAKIIDESENSLTFEFIEGISLEKKFNDAMKSNNSLAKEIIDNYLIMLRNSFKTIHSIENNPIDSKYRNILHNINFNQSDNFTYFKDISNIDLIFSNIIYKDDEIYLIDYEWVFSLNLPIHYALYRAFRATNSHKDINMGQYLSKHELSLFETLENNFFDNEVVAEKSFFKIKNNYNQNRVNAYIKMEDLRNQVHHLQTRISELQTQLKDSEDEVISYASSKSWQITRPMRKIVNYFKR